MAGVSDRAERMEMNALAMEDREKTRKDMAKRAVRLASQGKWSEAAKMNRLMLSQFPNDVETYNRLGKALSELGRNRDARAAFQSVLSRSPSNAIAKKNLARLAKLGDAESPKAGRRVNRGVQFLEESGKSGVASLAKLAPTDILRKMTPGDVVNLEAIGDVLTVSDERRVYLGQVERRVGARIARLMRGGNRYEATVTSAEDGEVSVIIRETYKSPSQARAASFPLRSGAADYRVYVPRGVAAYSDDDGETPTIKDAAPVKDWSDDDTEPGDDDVFDDNSTMNLSIIDAAEHAAATVGDEDDY